MSLPPPPAQIAAVIDAYDAPVRAGVRTLRSLIHEIARDLPEIGRLEEALRWGQPAFLTPESGAGSTLRIGPHRDACFALFAHCRTSIIATYAQAFPGWDRLDGNRAVLFDHSGQIDAVRLSSLIRHALTYHIPAGTRGDPQPPDRSQRRRRAILR